MKIKATRSNVSCYARETINETRRHLRKHNIENMLYAVPCHRVIDARHIQLVPDYFEPIPLKQELPNEKLYADP